MRSILDEKEITEGRKKSLQPSLFAIIILVFILLFPTISGELLNKNSDLLQVISIYILLSLVLSLLVYVFIKYNIHKFIKATVKLDENLSDDYNFYISSVYVSSDKKQIAGTLYFSKNTVLFKPNVSIYKEFEYLNNKLMHTEIKTETFKLNLKSYLNKYKREGIIFNFENESKKYIVLKPKRVLEVLKNNNII